jgi:arginyl-tRNA synthetase
MTTTSFPGLDAFVAELGLGPIPSFAASDVLNDPIDICRSYLAEYFQQLVERGPDLIYNAIQPPSTTVDGDLDIVLPRLKLPGAPKELAGELIKKVCQCFFSLVII